MLQNGHAVFSIWLDIIPVIALAALAVSFLRERHRRREEEKAILEKIISWEQEER